MVDRVSCIVPVLELKLDLDSKMLILDPYRHAAASLVLGVTESSDHILAFELEC